MKIEPGCTLSSKGYVFSRARQLIGEEIRPIYVNAMEGTMTQLLQQDPIDDELNSFLSQMIKRDNKGVKLVDIESKYSLHKLHHKTNLTQQVFSAMTSLILMIAAVIILYICRKNLTQICSTKRPNGRGQPIRMTQLSSDTASSSWFGNSESCAGNLQDFNNAMTAETIEDGRQETLENLNQVQTAKNNRRMRKATKNPQ